MLGTKILVIDDQAGIRALLIEVFLALGCVVNEASNGHEGYEVVEKCTPDLILLDMKMPGLSGLDTLRLLRARNSVIPIVLVTAYQENDMMVEAERLGVTASLSKPFDISELQKIVLSVVPTSEMPVAGH